MTEIKFNVVRNTVTPALEYRHPIPSNSALYLTVGFDLDIDVWAGLTDYDIVFHAEDFANTQQAIVQNIYDPDNPLELIAVYAYCPLPFSVSEMEGRTVRVGIRAMSGGVRIPSTWGELIFSDGTLSNDSPGPPTPDTVSVIVAGTNTIDPGEAASVENIGTPQEVELVFNIPKGEQGNPGAPATIQIASTVTRAPGTGATVQNTGTETNAILEFGIPRGQDGAAATVQIGTVSTGSPATNASVTNSGTSSAAVLDFVIPRGAQGVPGVGIDGTNATVQVGSTTTGAPGTNASVSNSGTINNAVFNFVIPRGDKGDKGDAGLGINVRGEVATATDLPSSHANGDAYLVLDENKLYVWSEDDSVWIELSDFQGPKGDDGDPGQAATVAVGTTTTGAAGTNAVVNNSGTSQAAVLDFTIPRGEPGTAATVEIGTVSTGSSSAMADVTNVGTPTAAVLDFILPRGLPGVSGASGQVFIGDTTTGAAGTSASVSNSGTPTEAVLNFTIPRGDAGQAATIEVGTVTTGGPGTAATVTNVGTSSAARFNFRIPQGWQGNAGVRGPAGRGSSWNDPNLGNNTDIWAANQFGSPERTWTEADGIGTGVNPTMPPPAPFSHTYGFRGGGGDADFTSGVMMVLICDQEGQMGVYNGYPVPDNSYAHRFYLELDRWCATISNISFKVFNFDGSLLAETPEGSFGGGNSIWERKRYTLTVPVEDVDYRGYFVGVKFTNPAGNPVWVSNLQMWGTPVIPGYEKYINDGNTQYNVEIPYWASRMEINLWGGGGGGGGTGPADGSQSICASSGGAAGSWLTAVYECNTVYTQPGEYLCFGNGAGGNGGAAGGSNTGGTGTTTYCAAGYNTTTPLLCSIAGSPGGPGDSPSASNPDRVVGESAQGPTTATINTSIASPIFYKVYPGAPGFRGTAMGTLGIAIPGIGAPSSFCGYRSSGYASGGYGRGAVSGAGGAGGRGVSMVEFYGPSNGSW